MSKDFLDVFSISLGHATTWTRGLRMNNKPMMTAIARGRNNDIMSR